MVFLCEWINMVIFKYNHHVQFVYMFSVQEKPIKKLDDEEEKVPVKKARGEPKERVFEEVHDIDWSDGDKYSFVLCAECPKDSSRA